MLADILLNRINCRIVALTAVNYKYAGQANLRYMSMNIVLTTIMRKKSAVQCYGLITISNRTEHLAGIARCDDTGRNILRDNAAYNNYRAFPNRHACGDLHISAEPHIIFNVNGLCHTDTPEHASPG